MKSKNSPAIGIQITLAARLYRTQLGRALSEIGLYAGQEQVLKALGSTPEGLSMGDLARALHVQPPTLTKTVQRLQSQALIERLAREGDGRVVLLTLTAAGEEKLTLLQVAEDKLEAELSALFKVKAEERLRKSLRRIVRHLTPHKGKAPENQPDPVDDADLEE